MTTHMAHRRRDTLIVIICVLGLIVLAFGSELAKLQSIVTPTLPGYQKRPPSGSYPPLAWVDLKQMRWNRNRFVLPHRVSDLRHHGVMLWGYMDVQPTNAREPVSEFVLADAPVTTSGGGCACSGGVSFPVTVHLAQQTRIPMTDWPVRVFGTLTVHDAVTDYREAVEITDAVVLIGMPPPWARGR